MTAKWVKRAVVVAGNAVILVSCLVNFVLTPYLECLLDGGCDRVELSPMTGMYARSLSVACFVSVSVVWSRHASAAAVYDGLTAAHDAYSAAGRSERRGCAAFNAAVTSVCMAIMLPVNAFRLLRFYGDDRELGVIMYFVMMYSHNLVLCLIELRFVAFTYVAYKKFNRVNRHMETIGERISTDGRHRRRRRRRPPSATDPGSASRPSLWIADGGDVPRYRSPTTGRLLVDAVERVKIRHRLIRGTVDQLNRVFALPMGMSLCNLCVMSLFDLYYHLVYVYSKNASPRSNLYIYLWITQYLIRFFMIIVTSNATTKQALRTKEIVMSVSKSCLDVGTKEELQIFSNQISSTSMEFSICDLFTLTTRLFTSALGAGVTYLVVLIQMKASTDIIY